MVFIYGLICPIADAVRYIGKSIDPAARLIGHLSGARTFAYKHHTSRWIRKLESQGLRPSLVILQELEEGQDWRTAEREWIARAEYCGWPLTNSTKGGEGLDYRDPEDDARYRAKLSATLKRMAQTPEGKERFRKLAEAGQTPEAKAKRIASLKEAWSDPARKAKLVEFHKGLRANPEVEAKRAASISAHWAENKEQMLEKIWTPETREKHRAKRVAAWADPVVGAKLRAIHSSPESRAKRSAKAQARATPEYRAMMAEKTRKSWEARRAKAQQTEETTCESR